MNMCDTTKSNDYGASTKELKVAKDLKEKAKQDEVDHGHDHDDNHLSQQVHSANSWETADLGDKQRNEKFLRLMGAAKKEHRGKIVIGDKSPSHKRQNKDVEHIEEELVEQYEHGLEHRMASGKKGHLGLGYHGSETQEAEMAKKDLPDETKGENTQRNTVEDEKGDAICSHTEEKRDSKRNQDSSELDESKPEVKKIKFIQGNS
ncbi:small acidic protein-like [Biomphalaria glabrata]|uniref:Small acidic protein n=1 Tax=Biomphalaria glabrata TaxID=6526 RepID=A0A9U8E9J0_BIOGL|nr:small acidic protein-like [Biomphalaria glabrata]